MTYRLKMTGYSGFGQTLGEGTLEEMQTKATKYIDRHDGDVDIVTPGMAWELIDPGTRMISDFDGHLYIVALVDPEEELEEE